MLRLLTVLGARPQFIKASSLSRHIGKEHDIEEHILHTGQHYDNNMSDIFFSDLAIPKPNFNLNVGSTTHGNQVAKMLMGIEPILLENAYDMVVVYGDTNTTLAGALCAAKLNVPVAHIESGLRSRNMRMPEELNRIVTDRISSIHFCPSDDAVANLEAEGIKGEFVVNCGDIMLETLLHYKNIALQHDNFSESMNLDSSPYILTTIHRAENTDNEKRLHEVSEALLELAKNRRVIFPVHPRTLAALEKVGTLEKLKSNCDLIDPVGFLQMIALIAKSEAVVTDSGGLQKEAYFLGKKCLVLRDQTEWHELISSSNAFLWPENSDINITDLLEHALSEEALNVSPYGNGESARLITDTIKRFF